MPRNANRRPSKGPRGLGLSSHARAGRRLLPRRRLAAADSCCPFLIVFVPPGTLVYRVLPVPVTR